MRGSLGDFALLAAAGVFHGWQGAVFTWRVHFQGAVTGDARGGHRVEEEAAVGARRDVG